MNKEEYYEAVNDAVERNDATIIPYAATGDFDGKRAYGTVLVELTSQYIQSRKIASKDNNNILQRNRAEIYWELITEFVEKHENLLFEIGK